MAKKKKTHKAAVTYVFAPGLTPRLRTRKGLPAAPRPAFWSAAD